MSNKKTNEKLKGSLFIISGPSGAGKGTIYNRILELKPEMKKSVSVTTRAPRPGEIEGVHYYFRTLEQYQEMIAGGEFLETAQVYKNCYGTPKAPVFRMLDEGCDVLFEIDTLGVKQVKARYPEAVAIFIMPPSFEILEQRLRGRGTESEESIQRRLSAAKSELMKYNLFDYIVFNDDIDKATADVVSIIDAEKRRIKNNLGEIQLILDSKKQ